jgi:hypothetical protein
MVQVEKTSVAEQRRKDGRMVQGEKSKDKT